MILASNGIIASQIALGPVATAATGVGTTSFTANWNTYTGAQYYLLDVSTSSSFSTFVYQDQVVLAPTTSYVVIGLTENTTYYYRVRAAIGVDEDAVAFFGRVYAASGSLTYTEVTATQTLVADLKANSLWTPMKAIYPMVGASAEACKQNLKSSSFTGTFSSGWTFASSGVTPLNAYMNTNYNPSVSGQLNSAHLSVYLRKNINLGAAMIGANDSNGRHYFGEGNGFSSLNSSDEGNYNPTSYAGFHLIKRETSTQTKQFYNGSLNTTSAIVSVARTNLNLYMGARNSNGSPLNYNTNQFAFLSIGDGLTDTQASNFYTAVQAFQTTLNRQIAP